MSIKKRILLVDDHTAVRTGYRRFLEAEYDMEVVGEAADAEECQKHLQTAVCDVLVLDVSMPGQSGMDLIKRLLLKWPDLKIVILTMHDSQVVAEKALNLGVRGFVTKSSDPDELIQAIRHAAGGTRYLSRDMADKQTVNLTPRETDIVRLLLEGKTIDETANSLGISSKTVSNNLSQIRSKLGLQTDFELARWAIEKGLGKVG